MAFIPEQKIISDLKINIDSAINKDLVLDLKELLSLLQTAQITEAFKLNEQIEVRRISGGYDREELDHDMHKDIWYKALILHRELKNKFKLD